MQIGKRIVIYLCIISIFLGGCSSENAEFLQGGESLCVEQNTGMTADEIVDSEPVREQMSGEEEIMEFLRGNRNAYSVNGDGEGVNIMDIITPTGEPDEHYFTRYTLFDSTGDGNPELHVRSVREYYIITCADGESELVIWAACYPQTELLNNGAFLYTHLGGAPSHEDFEYFTLDDRGNEILSVYFSRYDSDSDGDYDAEDLYLVEGEEVTWEMWQKSTEEYLSVGSDEIEWKEVYTETEGVGENTGDNALVDYNEMKGEAYYCYLVADCFLQEIQNFLLEDKEIDVDVYCSQDTQLADEVINGISRMKSQNYVMNKYEFFNLTEIGTIVGDSMEIPVKIDYSYEAETGELRKEIAQIIFTVAKYSEDSEIWWRITNIEEIDVGYDVYSKELKTVAYPQISGLEDEELERKVNESLGYVFEQDIAPDIGSLQVESYPPQIMFQSEKYLSVKTVLQYFNPNIGGGRLCSFPIYQTVSLETGELLQLDDLLEVSEERGEYIKEQYGADEMLAYFEEASANYDADNYASKCSFYLTPGEINIVHETETVDILYFKIRLELDDVQNYVKAENW